MGRRGEGDYFVLSADWTFFSLTAKKICFVIFLEHICFIIEKWGEEEYPIAMADTHSGMSKIRVSCKISYLEKKAMGGKVECALGMTNMVGHGKVQDHGY